MITNSNLVGDAQEGGHSKDLQTTEQTPFSCDAATILIFGSPSCGKTALVQRLVLNTFDDTMIYKKSLGANFVYYMAVDGSNDVRLGLWDVSGDSGHRDTALQFLAPSSPNIVLVLVDLLDVTSLTYAQQISRALTESCPSSKFVIAGTKIDNQTQVTVKLAEIKELAEKHYQSSTYRCISSRTGAGIQDLFGDITSIVMKT